MIAVVCMFATDVSTFLDCPFQSSGWVRLLEAVPVFYRGQVVPMFLWFLEAVPSNDSFQM